MGGGNDDDVREQALSESAAGGVGAKGGRCRLLSSAAALGAAPLVAFPIHLEPILRFAMKQHTKKGRANAAKFRQTHTNNYFIA